MYEDMENVRKLLLSIRDQTRKVNGVIIIDNSEKLRITKNDVACLTEIRPLYYYRLSQNMGSAAGFALGMSAALKNCGDTSDCWVWLNDSDGYPDQRCLENMLCDCKDNPDVGILCPVVYDIADKNFEDTTFRRFMTKWGTTRRCRSAAGRQFLNLAGTAGIMVSSCLIEKIGVYDYEHFFVNLEDYEYTLRAFRHSEKAVLLCPAAKYYHPVLPPRHKSFWFKHKLPMYMGTYNNNGNLRNKRYVYSAAFIVGRHLNVVQRFMTIGYSFTRLLFTKLLVPDISLKSTLKHYVSGYKDGRGRLEANKIVGQEIEKELLSKTEDFYFITN